MTIRKLAGLSAFTLFAAASLCAEGIAGTETVLSESSETGDAVSDEIVGGGTTKAIRYLIHYIVRMAKVEKFLIESLIDATDEVDAKVTISGSQNEEQTGDGITFGPNDAGDYTNDKIVAGYYIKDLYP
ncbi:MAG: hypothetical protein IJW12_01760, partial [Opitutales bacterium]|nr:hypothetical protein [Opitutales bacterium]